MHSNAVWQSLYVSTFKKFGVLLTFTEKFTSLCYSYFFVVHVMQLSGYCSSAYGCLIFLFIGLKPVCNFIFSTRLVGKSKFLLESLLVSYMLGGGK